MGRKGIKILFSLVLFLIALIFKFNNVLLNNVLFIISYLLVGFEVLREALRNILKKELFDESFLMSFATLGALVIGEFAEAVAVMLFYQIGEYFQNLAVNKSRKSIVELMDIRADYANLIKGQNIKKVDPEDVRVGDVIAIKPGEKVPLDGVVIEGKSLLDTKALTGEAIPKNVGIHDEILSGSLNLSGLLKLKVSKEFGESTVSKILDLVENASNKKSQTENFMSKFARFYTPIVVLIALFISLLLPLITKQSFSIWFYRALSFLVVSCPCALVVSIPLSFFGGIGGASRMGILIKGSNYLEVLAKVDTVVLDKTATLTRGIFKVQKIEPVGVSREELLKYAACCEKFSLHPIALALRKAYGSDIEEAKVENVKEMAGLGVLATVDKHKVVIGNYKLLEKKKISYTKSFDVGTVLYVAIDGKFRGTILISDEIKACSKQLVMDLKENNIKKIVMLTGDRQDISEDVAKQLQIDEVYAELLPQDKVMKMQELLNSKKENSKILFAGDGINDAPVIALADIGVAMGGLGADSAIEAADVVIMTDEVQKIVNAIKLARKTMRIVHENIFLAIFVKVVVLIFWCINHVGGCICRCRSIFDSNY